MKARSLEAAGGKPGHAGRSGRAPFFGPSSRTTAEDVAGGGTLVSGVLGAALLAAALLLAPGGARAADECGALSSGAASCTNQAFASGISYTVASGAGGLGLTVGGGAATTITASGSSHGVALSMGVTTTGNMALTVGSAGAVEIVEDSTASHGIHLRQDGSGTATADIRSGVTIGTASTPMGTDGVRFDLFRNTANKGGDRASLTSGAEIHAAGRGLVLFRAWDAQTNAATTLTNTGAVSAGVGNAASTALGNLRPHGILLNIAPPTDAGFNGDATLTNSGPVTVSGGYDGIRMVYNTHGDAVVDNRTGGDVTATAAGGRGIALLHSTGDGAATIRNAATINAAGDSADNNGTWQGAIALRRNGGTIAGVALIENRGDVTATAASAIYVYSLHGVIRVTNSGDLSGAGSLGRGIRTWTEGNGAVTVTSTGGEIASASAQGIHVRSDGAGAVRISSASDISARTGVLAEVTRASAMGETRAAEDQPLIGVTWTGTFARDAAKTAADDRGRFAAATAADVLSFDQESAAVKAMAETVHYGGAAGIEAHALSWRDVVTAVAKGDDPGAIADNTAQMNLLSTTHADSRRAAILARFRAALRNADLAVAAAVLTDVDSTATSVDDLDDTEIVAYLSTNDVDTRSLLRNVLAQGLSDKEKAVLRAVATNTGLDTALDDADAGFDNAYKTAVRALLERYNVGNIRVAMNGGSIDSRGDGIRAYYATPHDSNGGISVTVAEGASVTGAKAGVYVANAGGDVTVSNSGTVTGGTYGIYAANAADNGAIEVTVAEGASVTGAMAGIYVANAGPGLMLARKYTPEYKQGDAPDEVVPVMHGEGAEAAPLLNQLVTVAGTVTGGTDAAVHLNGGGAVLVMEGGRVHAGTSGVAIKVNDPGPALVHVEGEVKGGAGPDGAPAPAAVHLTGGGNVIIGLNGKVKAAGAARAIRGGGDEATMVALTLVTDGIITHREDAQEAYARVEGSTEDIEGDVRFREDRDGVPTGYSRMLPVGDDGMLDASTLEWGPCPDETHIRGDDGVCGTPPPGSGDDGSGDDGSGSDGSGDDGSGDDGSGDDGSGDDGSGDDGSGDDGSGDDGSGDDGSGDDGSGDDGSGSDGSGDDGSGSDGSGDDGSGSDGSGDDGSGAGVRVVVAAGGTVSRDDGIRAYYETPHDDNGGIEVTVAEGASVSGSVAGIYVANAGPGLRIPKRYAPKAIQELKANEDAGKDDLIAIGGLNAAGDAIATPYLNQLVTIAGTVTGGTDAAVHLVGGGAVIVMKGGRVHAGSSGVAIKVNDPGPALMYIDGEVKGGAGGAAAVHLTGGGSVIIGQEGKVEANGAARAIRGGGDEATKVALTLVTDDVIMYREDADEAYDARVEGSLADVGEVRFREDKNGIPTGYSKPLPVTDNGMLDPSELPSSTFSCEEAGDRRCRLYEALPSMLLAMNALPSYAERASAVRDGNGGWARVEAARGEWQAKKAETATMGGGKLAYDHRRSVGRAGIDFLAGESARVGVSVHALRGKAEMGGVGEVELDGMGGGLSATWLVGDLYVDAQAAVTLYDVDVESSTHGKMSKKDVYGAGYGLGVDVGRRMSVGGMMVTPRAGVGWSKVELDDFTDMERYGGPRARVSVEDGVSVKGRLGVMLEMEVGSGGTSGQVFGSLDVEQELSDETEAKVGGEMLKTEVRPTAVRLGLGGEFEVDEDVVVRVTGGYRTSGSGTIGYGGGLELRVRF